MNQDPKQANEAVSRLHEYRQNTINMKVIEENNSTEYKLKATGATT